MKLYLVDGYGFVFRAFHSLPTLIAPDETPIGAVHGFANMLFKLLESHDADMLAVVLDAGQKNFRHEIYPEYKANRPEPPDELRVQFPIIREVLEAFAVPCIEKPGFEADDLIATYTRKAEAEGAEVRIISADKDLMQLVSDKVKLYDSMRDKFTGTEEVFKKFGVKPDGVIEALALIGDTADNVPGVTGIGPKTAAELLMRFETIQGIYDNIEKVTKPRVQKLLIENQENAFLSRKLVSLDSNVELSVELSDLKIKTPDKELLGDFLKKYGLKSLLSRIEKGDNKAKKEYIKNEEKKTSFKKISDISRIPESREKIIKNGIAAIHFDDSKLTISSQDLNLSFEIEAEQSNSGQQDLFSQDNCSMGFVEILEQIKPIFENPSVKKIFY